MFPKTEIIYANHIGKGYRLLSTAYGIAPQSSLIGIIEKNNVDKITLIGFDIYGIVWTHFMTAVTSDTFICV